MMMVMMMMIIITISSSSGISIYLSCIVIVSLINNSNNNNAQNPKCCRLGRGPHARVWGRVTTKGRVQLGLTAVGASRGQVRLGVNGRVHVTSCGTANFRAYAQGRVRVMEDGVTPSELRKLLFL